MTLNVVALFQSGEKWIFVYDAQSIEEIKEALWSSGLSSDQVLRVRDHIKEQTNAENA